MENIKKFDIKSFVAGLILMGGAMGGGFYYFYNTSIEKGYVSKDEYNKKITEVAAYVPEIKYNHYFTSGSVTGVFFNDWFNKYKDYYQLPYFRVMNKDYLVSNGGTNGYLENQLEIRFGTAVLDKDKYKQYFNKCSFEQELKKYTDKDFTILNLGNTGGIWTIDFDSKVTKEEIEKIKSGILSEIQYENHKVYKPLYINYNSVLLPTNFNDNGFGIEVSNNKLNY